MSLDQILESASKILAWAMENKEAIGAILAIIFAAWLKVQHTHEARGVAGMAEVIEDASGKVAERVIRNLQDADPDNRLVKVPAVIQETLYAVKREIEAKELKAVDKAARKL